MRIDGSNGSRHVDAESSAEMHDRRFETGSLMPVPAATTALAFGDVGGTIAALLLKANQNSQDAARAQEHGEELREDQEQAQQLQDMRDRADKAFVSGIASGMVRAASGLASFAATKYDVSATEKMGKADSVAADAKAESVLGANEGWSSAHFEECARLGNLSASLRAEAGSARALHDQLDLTAKLTAAGSDAVRASGERLAAECDIRAKEHEQSAAHAEKRLNDVREHAAELAKFARDVVAFVGEFERAMDQARSAAVHRA